MSTELLRKAATILRERAEGAKRCAGMVDKQIRDMTPVDFRHVILPAEVDYIRVVGDPGVGLALARWLDAEAQMLDTIEPWVDLLNAAVIDSTGDEKAVMRLMKDEDGGPQIFGDSSPSAVALARLIVGDSE